MHVLVAHGTAAAIAGNRHDGLREMLGHQFRQKLADCLGGSSEEDGHLHRPFREFGLRRRAGHQDARRGKCHGGSEMEEFQHFFPFL